MCALRAKPSRYLTLSVAYMSLLRCSVFSPPPPNQYLIRGYESQQRRTMGVKAMSHMLSTHLYYRRSFPFYTFNILGGLDDEGAVGRCSSTSCIRTIRMLCRRFVSLSTLRQILPPDVSLKDFCVRFIVPFIFSVSLSDPLLFSFAYYGCAQRIVLLVVHRYCGASWSCIVHNSVWTM